MRSLVLAFTLAAMLAAVPAFAAGYGDDSHKAGDYDADNSGRNARDRDDQRVTPADQGGSAADRDVTAKIRKSIVDDDSLSTDAHNVKVVTQNGVVTLRGPVESASEKSSIAAKAKKVGGVKRVDNQLEIEKTAKK